MVGIGKHNKIIPFKGREIDLNKPVEVYRCLRKKTCMYSIRQKGKVVAHTNQLTLKDAKFVIHRLTQERTKVSGISNSHAFIRGKINILKGGDYKKLHKVTYDPFEDDSFIYHTSSSYNEIHSSELVVFTNRGIFSDILN